MVAVAGTHGKTTTTSLLTVALQQCGADPSFAIGGELNESGSNAHDGSGEIFVAEADESDGAFLVYSPHGAVVTNVEADHLDNYGTEEAYRAAFSTFLDRIRPGGFLVACVDDPGAADAGRGGPGAGHRGGRGRGVGDGRPARRRPDLRRGRPRPSRWCRAGAGSGEVTLQIPGRHYVLDALAALAAGLRLGFAFDELRRGLESFTGTRRRMELKGEAPASGSTTATPTTPTRSPATSRPPARSRGRAAWWWRSSRTWSRARRSSGRRWARRWAPPTRSSSWTSTSPARTRSPASTARWSPRTCRCPRSTSHFVPSWSPTPAALVELARPGDVVLTLGAGDVTLVGPEVLVLLEEREVEG